MFKRKICICGAGHQGLAMAAHLSLCNVDIALWNRTEKNIQKIIDTHNIESHGIVEGTAVVPIVSGNIEDCISDTVMITAPSNAHRDIAKVLAPFVSDKMTIVLNPGRSFGSVDFAKELVRLGVKELPNIAETQSIVYTCRKMSGNSVYIYTLKSGIMISSLKGQDVHAIISKLPECIRDRYTPCYSQIKMALSNVGMLLHCAPVLLNTGWIECSSTEFKYYYDGISQSVAHIVEKIDAERIAIAHKLGVEILSLQDWLKAVYGVTGGSVYECLKNNDVYREIDAPTSMNTRYILEDVPNGLVALEAVGKEIGCDCTVTSLIIDLACSMYDIDFRKIGRGYSIHDEYIRE